MNKKIIISIIICTLMVVTVFPATGLPIQPGKMTAFKTKLNHLEGAPHLVSSPPGPGDMAYPYPGFSALNTITTSIPQPARPLSRTSDFVVDLINQVDESTFFSYEQNITGFGPRYTGSSSCKAAATYIYNEFAGMGLAVRYDNWSNGGYSASNIEATLPGTDVSSDAIYIVCGHYDTVQAGPGADDDGSGTVATILLAKIMSQYQFNYTIRFVTFSGEEQGLLGSAVYAAEARANGDNIVGVLNADMISYAITHNDGANLIIFEDTASEWMYGFMVNVESLYNEYIDLSLVHGGYTWGSDHNSFWDEGYNAIFAFEFTETPYYHTSGDTMEHINITYATKNTKLLIASLAELAVPSEFPGQPATPNAPTGPSTGVIYTSYTYTATAPDDPDGSVIYLTWDWGNGTTSNWSGPYTEGQQVQAAHSWDTPGIYAVRVKVKDINNSESSWSKPLNVTINSKSKLEITKIKGGVGVSVTVHNKINSSLYNTMWTITLNGGFIMFPKTYGGFIPTLSVNQDVIIKTGLIIGFGRINIIASAGEATKTASGFLLGPILLGVK